MPRRTRRPDEENEPIASTSAAAVAASANSTATANITSPASSANRRNNRAYFGSVEELLYYHRRLVHSRVEVTTRESFVAGLTRNTLLQTVVRMHVSVKNKKSVLRSLFFDLFREHSESALDGFEVVTTFNVILANQVSDFFTTNIYT